MEKKFIFLFNKKKKSDKKRKENQKNEPVIRLQLYTAMDGYTWIVLLIVRGREFEIEWGGGVGEGREMLMHEIVKTNIFRKKNGIHLKHK